VLNFLITLGATGGEAEEGVQEVFTRIWEKRKTVRTDLRLRPFLLAIARNYHINERKSRARERPSGGLEYALVSAKADDPARRAENADAAEALRRTVEELPLSLREPFVLSRLQELTYKEIGQMLGISHRTVEDRMAQAYEQLRRKLGHFGR
jgi:RNA polymerase sigma-70 factor (ECF subfamily)